MAVEIRGLGRLLVALALMGWGQFSFSADYSWVITSQGHFVGPTPADACRQYASFRDVYSKDYTHTVKRLEFVRADQFRCYIEVSRKEYTYISEDVQLVTRSGDSCPSGSEYNPSTGECTAPQVPCANRPAIWSADTCDYISALKTFSCSASKSYQGCEFIQSGSAKCDVVDKTCTRKMVPTGDPLSTGDTCTDSSCAEIPAPSPEPSEPAEPICVGPTCTKDPDSDCVTENGKEKCYSPDKNCGTVNGELVCTDKEKPNRQCGYANGQDVCFDPSDPTKIIPPDSPDHPKNGGNADGNQNNDPMEPGTTPVTKPQSSDSAATNKSINDLGDKLGSKIDKSNSLLGGISGKLDQIISGIGSIGGGGGGGNGSGQDPDGAGDSGEDGDGSGSDGTDIGALGASVGDAIAEKIESETDDALAEYDAELSDEMDKIPDAVQDWFGEQGDKVDRNNILDQIIPKSSSCRDYTIGFSAGGYSFSVDIPFCELTRAKTILEWVLWAWTAIALWKVLYAGLRLQDATATRGGY